MPSATSPAQHGEVTRARFDDLSPGRLYDLLRLRSAVFVVEQECAFLDLDGRDREPGAEHLWIDDADGVAGCLRLLDEGDGEWSIGRVVTRPDVRCRGVGAALVRAGLDRLGELGCRRVRLGAQAHLAGWYAAFGFSIAGPEYLEDDIAHVPMALHLASAQ